LQLDVDRLHAESAAVHRRQHLNVLDRIEAEAERDALGDDGVELAGDVLGIIGLDQVEIADLALGFSERDLALVDAVGVDDDPGAERLAEDLGQARSGRGSASRAGYRGSARSHRRS
jgi:hypothetical protein